MKHGRACVLASAFLLALPMSARAYPVDMLDAKRLLDRADLVCHGKVLSIDPSPIEKDSSFRPALETKGAIAHVGVLNVIKGKAAEQVAVLFRLPTNWVAYAELRKGEECILFLCRRGDAYRFADEHNRIPETPPHKPIAYRSPEPDGRLVEELILGTRAETGLFRLVCVEQLAKFPLIDAITRLRELAQEKDMAVQGTAYAGLVELDCPPPATEVARFLARGDDTKSYQRSETTGYSNGSLKARVLTGIEDRFNVIGRDFDVDRRYSDPEYAIRAKSARTAANKWRDFDIIAVLKPAPWEAREDEPPYADRRTAEIIGEQLDGKGVPAAIGKTYRRGSRPIAIRLLHSRDTETRFAAARAIDKMIAAPHAFPYPQHQNTPQFSKELGLYVQACRAWLDAHTGWAKEDE